MSKMLIAIAATATLVVGTAGAEPVRKRAYDPITAGYQQQTGDFCIRSGWGIATASTNRRVRRGDCRSAKDWNRRGLSFDMPKPVTTIAIASR